MKVLFKIVGALPVIVAIFYKEVVIFFVVLNYFWYIDEIDKGSAMHQILVWQLTHQINLTFSSSVADLGSITCCDRLTLSVGNGQKTSTLTNDLAGCQVEKLEKMLQSLVAKEQKSINFSDLMSLKVDSFDQVLVCLHGPDGFISYQIVDLIMIKGWIQQLELLHVLMEENDLEKKSRGKGCC